METPRAEERTVQLETTDPGATRRAGEALARATLPLPSGGIVVALHGDLGAGKTVFVQGVARGLGVPASQRVVSPTFTVARDYRCEGPERVTLHHVDAYRLRGAEELDAAGFEEMCGEGRLTCVEWAERVEDAMPADRLEVSIDAGGPDAPDARSIEVRATGPQSRRVLERLRRSLASVRAGS